MQKVQHLFLEALGASLYNRKVNWKCADVSAEEVIQVFQMADVHHIIPMIYEAVFDCEVVRSLDPGFQLYQRRCVIQAIAMQAMKTSEFQLLSDHLRAAGVTPCVVKGVICRNLYPNPDARMSGDEDVLIPEEQFAKAHKAMLDFGMVLSNTEEEIEKVYEVPYSKVGSPLYIEIHKHLFPPESEAYGDMNRFFQGVHNRLVEVDVQGTKFLTMNPTDHLFYLICHSFKHFLHSGFGIRQVCDIVLYANVYGKEIDWEYVLKSCREIRADLFAASMFRMGEKYLTFDVEKAYYPESWRNLNVDESTMLEDLLASGVYGQSNMSRKHSSNITLNAVIADKRGEKASSGKLQSAIKAVCLPVDKLSDRFTYLKKMPILLPVAWIQRVWIYRKETAGNHEGNNAEESIKIGNERIELMRKYGIIK